MESSASSLEDICASTGVEPTLCNSLIQDGWTSESFGLVATDLEGLDQVFAELFPDATLNLLQKAQLRAAFRRCQMVSSQEPAPTAGPKASEGSSSWSESFAPKLDHQSIHEMKQKFLKNYPSEILNADTTPSTRLLSLVHHQIQRKEWKWVPWRYRLSVSKCEEIQSHRMSKIPSLH